MDARARVDADPGVTHVYQAAIVGAGPGGLIAFAALRYAGLAPEECVVVDPGGIPLAGWSRHMASISQAAMRSESEGHFLPTDFPGFALMDALHRLRPHPLVASVFNRYTPAVGAVLAHGEALSRNLDVLSRIEVATVARLAREQEPEPHVALLDDAGRVHARARHVLLALGHAGLRWPEVCSDPAVHRSLTGTLYHAYEPKHYGQCRVAVIGGGMAGATEWCNVLRAGGHVLSIHRAPRRVEQPLSAPRCTFGGPWLDRYHALDPEARLETLRRLEGGTFRLVPQWRRDIQRARSTGRFRECAGQVVGLERSDNGEVTVRVQDAFTGLTRVETCDMVVAATGFTAAWDQYPLLQQLAADHDLTTHGLYLALADDCSIPTLTGATWSVTLSGPAARWAYPAADSFAGMKYAARRFAARSAGRNAVGPRPRSWFQMARAGWPYSPGAAEAGGRQCASR